MSSAAAPEQRAWQRPRAPPAVGAATPQSRSSNASPNPTNQPSKPVAPAPAPGNIWAERAKERSKDVTQKPSSTTSGKETSGPKEGNKKVEVNTGVSPAPTQASAPAPATAPVTEQHTSLNGFNAAEAREFLKRGPKQAAYKSAETGASKTSGAWGSKPHNMANGQPFFVQLSKQVAALQAKQ